MGDAPYAFFEDWIVRRDIQQLPERSEFLVHVGDIKRGAAPCDETHYETIARLLQRSKTPAFILPGDNEWNDCEDPEQAWQYWRKHLFQLDQHWNAWPVQRQPERQENFRFQRGGVLFIGINLVGGRVHDAAEWRRRHLDDLHWIQKSLDSDGRKTRAVVVLGHAAPAKSHDDFFPEFERLAREYGKPMLYLHGDGHAWKQDQPWKARNLWRVQVDRGGIAPPVQVTVTVANDDPFVFDRRK